MLWFWNNKTYLLTY